MKRARFIAAVCGLKSEAQVVRSAFIPMAHHGHRLAIGVSGADAARAEEAAHAFARDGAAVILSIGVSGGLSRTLAPGDLVLGEAVRTAAGDAFLCDRALLAAVSAGFADSLTRGALYGSDSIIASPAEKAALFAGTGAIAVDMESHGAARAAMAAGVPFLAIRAIADPASRALPPAALDAVAPDGSTKTFSVLLQCAIAPRQFPALLQLGSDSNAALKSLRGGLGGLFGRLLLRLDL